LGGVRFLGNLAFPAGFSAIMSVLNGHYSEDSLDAEVVVTSSIMSLEPSSMPESVIDFFPARKGGHGFCSCSFAREEF
jgi:hypothetical protein